MREQIGPKELTALLFGFLIGSSLVVPMGIEAKESSWLAVLLGGAVGLAFAWIYTGLARRFPDQSLIGYSRQVLGRWLGSLVGLLFVWYGFHIGALVLRNFGEFVVATNLPNTPMVVPILLLAVAGAYGVRHGIEVLGRAAQIMTAIVVLQVLLVTALLIKDFHLERLLPIAGEGILPVLRGSFTALSFPFGEAVLFALLLPMVRPPAQVRPTVLRTIAGAALLLTLVHARNTAVLGAHVVATERFPTFGVIQAVDVADFITRLDAVVVGNWIVTGYMKVSVCLLATARGLAEWTGAADYRPLVLPIAVGMSALSLLLYGNISEMATFATSVWPLYSLPFQFLLPLLLLGVAALRRLGAKGG